jgi:hypothetical protein
VKRVAAVCTLLALSACSLDLAVPPTPQRGGIVGRLDTQGHLPLADWPMSLSGEQGETRTQLTDAQGAFAFADVAPGLYSVGVTLTGFGLISSGLVRVQAGANTDLGVLSSPWLKGSPQDGTLVGKLRANGDGDVTGAKLEFLVGGVALEQTLVAGDGAFAQRLPPGTYNLRASHPVFVTVEVKDIEVQTAQTTDLSAKPVVLDINPAVLAGSISRERDNLPPVPAVDVHVTLDTGQTTVSDAAGRYHLTGLAAGPRQVRFTAPHLHDAVPSRPVTLRPGLTSTLEPIVMQLNRGAIVGSVTLADGASISGARVEVVGFPYGALVAPDASDPSTGHFRIAGVPVGSYSLTARRDQYSNASVNADVTNDGVADVGALTLARLQGDFVIDDSDANNAPGYTRTLGVTLRFTGFPPTGVAEYRASEDGTMNGVAFRPYTGPNQPFTLETGDGRHTVFAQYKDTGGVVSAAFSSVILLDTVPPLAPVLVLDSSGSVGGLRFTRSNQRIPARLVASDGSGSGVRLMRVGAALLSPEQVDGVEKPYQADTEIARATGADGEQEGHAQVIDFAGNVSPVVSDRVIVDTVSPSGGLTLPSGPRATALHRTNTLVQTVALNAMAQPNGEVLQVRLANTQAGLMAAVYQPLSASVAWFLDPLGEGEKTVFAQLRDTAGNESAPLFDTITYDTTPPNPAVVSVTGAPPLRNPALTLVFTTNPADLSADAGVTVSDEASFTSAATVGPMGLPASGQLSFSVPGGEGTRTVYVRYRDGAGNDAIASTTVAVDTVPPTGSFSIVGNLADLTSSSTLTADTDVLLSVQAFGATEFYAIDGPLVVCPPAGYQALVASAPMPLSLVGSAALHTVHLCLRDAAGNTGGPWAQSITLDGAAPTGCVLAMVGTKVDGSTPAPAGKTGRPVVSVSITGCTEAPRELFLTEDAMSCSPTAANAWQPFQVTSARALGGADGPRTLHACLRDAARNTVALTDASITLDTTPPDSTSVTLNAGARYLNAAQVATNGLQVTVTGRATGATEWAFGENPLALSTFNAFTTPSTSTLLPLGGTGARWVYAVFRDDVGNASPASQGSIVVDDQPPSLTGVALAPLGNQEAQAGFTRTNGITLSVTNAPPDVSAALVLQGTGAPGVCAAAAFAGLPSQIFAKSIPFVLTGSDGVKTLCAQLYDEAGNASAPLSATITLDTVTPTQPQIITAPTTVAVAPGASFTVSTSGPVTEANFFRYERLGGLDTIWTNAGGAQGVTGFSFSLKAAVAGGSEQSLRLRAADQAGNISPEALVTVTNISPAQAPIVDQRWVDNQVGSAAFYWQRDGATRLRGFKLYYGAASGSAASDYRGLFAAEGGSPVFIPAANPGRFVLSGLNDGSPVYARLSAVDEAGNESALSATQMTLQPNVMPANLVAELGVAGLELGDRIVVQDHHAYVAGRANWNCGIVAGWSTPMATHLAVVDLSSLVSPIHAGAIDLAAPAPRVTLAVQTFNDNLQCPRYNASFLPHTDLLVDGPWLFMASGEHLRIFSLLAPGTPALVRDLVVPKPALSGGDLEVGFQNLALVGDVLFAIGSARVVALDLSKLYDADAATLPTVPGDILGTVLTGNRLSAGALVTRDRLVQTGSGRSSFLLGNALDHHAGTAWDDTARIGSPGVGLDFGWGRPTASGNFLYSYSYSTLSVLKLNTLWGALVVGPDFANPDGLASHPVATSNGLEVAGPFAWALDGAGAVRTVDLTRLTSQVVDQGAFNAFSTGASPTAAALFGPYLMVAGQNTLAVHELGAPRNLRARRTSTEGGAPLHLSGAFLTGGLGRVFDLQNGEVTAPMNGTLESTTPNLECVYGVADSGELQVAAAGNALLVSSLEPQTGRTAGLWTTAQVQSIAMPAGTRVTGVAFYGPWLVAAELRASGVWLEVFDARALRDRDAATLFAPAAASKAAIQLSAATSTTLWATVSVTSGRAAVGLADSKFGFPAPAQPSPGLYLVDLRGACDDSAGGSLSLLGSVAGITGVRETVIRGGVLYAATERGLRSVDVHEAMDELPATTLPASPPVGGYDVNASGGHTAGFDSLAVYGGHLLASPSTYQGNAVRAFDISTPMAPTLVSSGGFTMPGMACNGTYDAASSKYTRSSVVLSGPRAYASTRGQTTSFDLR